MMDYLIERIQCLENPSVVGLDPTIDMIPTGLKEEMLERFGKTPKAVAHMFLDFNREIINQIYDLVPAIKPQIAMYERYGLDGLSCYLETIVYAKKKGLLVIGDIKRGDISSTADAYAAHLGGTDIEGEHFDLWQEDAVTVNPYLGTDGILPFLKACKVHDRSLFVLVKTSNPGSGELQDRLLEGEPLYLRVADLVDRWGKEAMGKRGYSQVGAVVGATHKEQGEVLRHRLPSTMFLVPGYGAQGGKGRDLTGYFQADGLGALVNSSRGIIAAYQLDPEFAGEPDIGREFGQASRKAVLAMRADLQLAMEG
jgi:orotidine-5'-phosphate decarboxylase